MAEPPTRVFYRIVQTDPPTLRDFLSNEALGRNPKRPLSELDRRCWRGASHYDSRELAAFPAGRSPSLGALIATIALPARAPIEYEQTHRPRNWPPSGDAQTGRGSRWERG